MALVQQASGGAQTGKDGAAPGRADGTRGGGPQSEAGKARSARNAWKHGLRAKRILVGDEEAEAYSALRERLFAQWAPRNDTEAFLVHRMAGAMWRLLRCPEADAELITTLSRTDPRDACLSKAMLPSVPGAGITPLQLTRYEAALERTYYRSLNLLRLLRSVGGSGIEAADAEPVAEPDRVAADWAEDPEPAEPVACLDTDVFDDDAPLEVEEVILDGPGGPFDPARFAGRPNADKFPNELPPGARDGANRRPVAGQLPRPSRSGGI
jgi:hypothetical protein